MIAQFRRCASGSIVRFGSGSQMIAEQVVQRVIIAHRHPLTAGVVIFLRRAAIDVLVVVADVVGGHAVQHGFDAVAVAVVDEAGVGGAAYGLQTVFDQYTTRALPYALTPTLRQRCTTTLHTSIICGFPCQVFL